MDRRFNILLVDDSKNILKSLRRSFVDENYVIFEALSAKEALVILLKEEIDLILTDENMPAITGTELLKTVRTQFPSVIRMMLTGLTDFETVKNAINRGEIYKFFNKPWDEFELLLSVKYALKQKELLEENNNLKIKLKSQTEYLVQLEGQYPGISSKNLSDDGSIILQTEDGPE